MAPVAVASSPSPQAAIFAAKAALLNDGSATPYSTTSTAVSEAGDKTAAASPKGASTPIELLPGQPGYIASLVHAHEPLPSTVAGTTVYGSALEVIEALAVQKSSAVFVYDDAVEVGFGARLAAWKASGVAASKVNAVQTREGAGLELAGYAKKAAAGKISVFASTSTLPYLAPHLESIDGDVVIHVAATEPNAELELTDALAAAGVLKALTTLPETWDVVFSAGADVVATGASLYNASGKVINVIESTFSAREQTSYQFPSVGGFEEFTVSEKADSLFLTVASAAASSITAPKVVLNTLTPTPEAFFAAVAGETKRTLTVVGPTKADAEALKAVVLALLYSAPTSSSAVFPRILSATTPEAVVAERSAKIVTFFTAPEAPAPRLLNHLFLGSPSLQASLAEFGSTWINGTKSVLALANDETTQVLTNETPSDLIWVSDASVLKFTDVLATAKEGASLILELPWEEADIKNKLSAAEIQTIQQKNIRVFLLDLDASCAFNAIKEQVAFLLLYTGSKKLPRGVWKVLDAFHGGNLGRDQVEEAQAALGEIPSAEVKAWEVDEEKVGKTKAAWVWDGIAGEAPAVDAEAKPAAASWELAARHVFFREAYAVEGANTVDNEAGLPGITALCPELTEKTYLVNVSENRRLTPMTYDRNVFHLELDSTGTGLTYEIGEAIGIHGWNEASEVLEFIEWYGLDPEALVSTPLADGTVATRTIFQLLQQNVDLFGQPGKSFYGDLAKIATDRHEAMTAKFISAPEGAEHFQKLAENETVNYVDVLKLFKSAHPSIEELIELIPEIKPRHYSIASSNKAVGDKVELLIVTVDWTDSTGRQRFGQCTRYLAALQQGATVTVSIKPSVMKLPPHDSQPIIMAGLGTGAAPFRAFMQHRAWQRTQGLNPSPVYYFFGSRHRSQEYLYGEDIEAYVAAGIIGHAGLAFSRDGKDKVYIQHKMQEYKKELAAMLLAEGKDAGYFYLCGPTWPVPDVFEALASAITDGSDKTREEAEQFIEDLKEEERYVLEVY